MALNLIDPLEQIKEMAPDNCRNAVRTVLQRDRSPVPFDAAGRIPWHDPGFGERILQWHLSQDTDRASRYMDQIAAEAAWIAEQAEIEPGAIVLDLACGPGLYAAHWSRIGARVAGMDVNPAALRYAAQHCAPIDPRAAFIRADVRSALFVPQSFDLISYIYGEPSTWTQDGLYELLTALCTQLKHGGRLIIEACSKSGLQDGTGTKCEELPKGLFSDRPHIYCEELAWHAPSESRLDRYYIIDLQDGSLAEYSAAHQGYSPESLELILRRAGLRPPGLYGDLCGEPWDETAEWVVAVVQK